MGENEKAASRGIRLDRGRLSQAKACGRSAQAEERQHGDDDDDETDEIDDTVHGEAPSGDGRRPRVPRCLLMGRESVETSNGSVMPGAIMPL